MENAARLDRVSIFDDKLSFLIPHEWVEIFDTDHYLYYHPETESGWLRVTLISVRTGDEAPAECLKKIFGSKENVDVEHQTGNLVSVSDKESEEDGNRIHLYYWMVANVVPPDLVREAVFSYAVLLDRVHEEGTKEMVRLVGELVSRADFRPNERDYPGGAP
jgi:hypothetical protein